MNKLSFVFTVICCFIGAEQVVAQDRVVPSSREQVQLSFAPIVERVTPAVVNIYTQKIVTQRQVAPLFDDPFFKRFFGGLSVPFGDGRPRARQNSLGSGVIVRKDGLIVTNRHVIEGADKIVVVLFDKRELEAEVVVADDRTDLAFLQVDPGDEVLTALELRDSDELRVGDLVLAIGNPFGVGQTVTSGIVSAIARSVGSGTELRSFIQTDAAINPGNSGGALVTMDGRLVGVNTAIFSRSGGSHGIGFAVPANMVRAVVAGMRPGGVLVRPWLGAYGQAVTSDIALSLGMRRPEGVIISQVHKDSSAAYAGIRAGDVILAINGHTIFSPDDMDYRIATLPVGERAVLRVKRGDTVLPLSVDLESAPANPEPDQTELSGRHPFSGAVVANVSPALAEQHSLNPFDTGVAILAIRRGSIADRLDFQPGDILSSVNQRRFETVAEMRDYLSAEQAEEWRVEIMRRGQRLQFVFRG